MKSLFALLACALLAGCTTAHSPKTISPADTDRQITLAVGQVLVIELPGNPTTGYTWTAKKIDGDALTRLGDGVYKQNPAPERMEGVGGVETWKFQGAKAGRQTLRFEYARSWEKDTAPARVAAFEIVVQ